MKYYVALEDKNPKQAADYTVADFKALISSLKKDASKDITLTTINTEAEAIESAKAQSTGNSAFVVFALTANPHRVKDGKTEARFTTFESAVHVEPKKTGQFVQVLKSGLKLALLVSAGGAALAFAGILPVAGIAAQFALGTAITAGTMVAAKATFVGVKLAVKTASAITNAVKNYFSHDKAHADELPKQDFTEEELKEQTDKLLESLNGKFKTNPELVAHAINNSVKGLFTASQDGFVVPPAPKAETQEENKAETKEENTKSATKKIA